MLAAIRRVVAVLVLLAFAALCSGLVPEAFVMRIMGTPRVQFVPLLMSSLSGCLPALGLLAVLVSLTLLFGRVYCSWICPLGILQDIVNRLLRPRGMKHARYTPGHCLIRVFFALASFGSLAFGSVLVLSYLDPYSICSRAFGTLPLLLRASAESGACLGVGVVAVGLALPLGMAAWRGRLYCNTLCPVGAVLGALSCFALYVPRINSAACRRCGSCVRRCKAHAIDLKRGGIDSSRCVGCYDCVAACPHRAVTLRKPAAPPAVAPGAAEPADPTRRAMVGLGAISLASTLFPLPSLAEEELTANAPNRVLPILPPGAGEDRERFLSTCTGCGLCISNCPTGVLRPSLSAHGWDGFLKPYLAVAAPRELEAGRYCRYDCNLCTTLCPTGALPPLSLADKQHARLGLAQHDPARCIPWQTGHACGHCVEACPTHALSLRPATVPVRDNPSACTGCRRCLRVCPQGAISLCSAPTPEHPEHRVAVVDHSKCIGCGACAAVCRRHVIRAVAVEVPTMDASRCIGCGACTAHCPGSPGPAIEPKAAS